MTTGQAPKVFVSYVWEDGDAREWGRGFAARLRSDGVEVILDQWDTVPEEQIPGLREQALEESDFILCICTPRRKKKSVRQSGGAGYEGDVLTGEAFINRNRHKIIPVLRKGEWQEAIPLWLPGEYVDLRGEPYPEDKYAELLEMLLNPQEDTSTIIITGTELRDVLKGLALPDHKLYHSLPGDLTEAALVSAGTRSEKSKGPRSPGNRPPARKRPKKSGGGPADEVGFTAFHPEKGRIDTWHTLLVYAHLASAIDEVCRDAGRFEDQLSTPRKTKSDAIARIVPGTRITITPVCDGILFNPPDTYVEWREDWHRLNFRFRADRSLLDNAAKGRITIRIGPLIIGTLNFAMLFSSDDTAAAVQEEHASMYHRDRIFISYSHKDTELVSAFKKVHEATGFDVLIDTEDLQAGQEWNPELMRMIDRADIFQLFWSENSKSSKYCRQEWEHALQRAAEGFIRPVYWQTPMPEPPEELSKYHFEQVEL